MPQRSQGRTGGTLSPRTHQVPSPGRVAQDTGSPHSFVICQYHNNPNVIQHETFFRNALAHAHTCKWSTRPCIHTCHVIHSCATQCPPCAVRCREGSVVPHASLTTHLYVLPLTHARTHAYAHAHARTRTPWHTDGKKYIRKIWAAVVQMFWCPQLQMSPCLPLKRALTERPKSVPTPTSIDSTHTCVCLPHGRTHAYAHSPSCPHMRMVS